MKLTNTCSAALGLDEVSGDRGATMGVPLLTFAPANRKLASRTETAANEALLLGPTDVARARLACNDLECVPGRELR